MKIEASEKLLEEVAEKLPHLCCEDSAAEILVGADRAIEATKSGAAVGSFGVHIGTEVFIFQVTKQ